MKTQDGKNGSIRVFKYAFGKNSEGFMTENCTILHPCFNYSSANKGILRMHLPIAEKCNMKCKYCRSDASCSNDCLSTCFPGQAQYVLNPDEAFEKVKSLKSKNERYKIFGVSGPGDPLANPFELFKTIELIKSRYSDIEFCISTNGVELTRYMQELLFYNIKYITLTINTLREKTAENIYEWCFAGKNILRGKEAARYILEKQRQAIELLNQYDNIFVKINTVYIPQINSEEIEEIVEFVNDNNAYIYNLMPLIGVNAKENAQTKLKVSLLREQFSKLTNVMTHCKQCRSDDIKSII